MFLFVKKLIKYNNKKQHVLRVKKGDYFKNLRQNSCYVVKNNKALRTDVSLGIDGMDYIEVEKGLDSGDVVIISNISGVKPLKVLEIK